MPDVIRELYEKHVYPAMSHPLSDPAVSAVAARMGGLEVPHPRGARILEIGCCSGHNLLPLAVRWPESEFVGIDLSERSIDEARSRASLAGIRNAVFHAADLRQFDPGRSFDFIIAHGFLSWVPDDVKGSLFDFCRRTLSPSGIATISFNLECGWKPRLPVIAKVRAIKQATGNDEMSALGILRSLTDPRERESAIIDDMLAKGPAILAFDDFAPINDPWPLDRFVREAEAAGLRWLGESDPGANVPPTLSDERLDQLKTATRDPLAFQLLADEAAGRTFRSGILCRSDAPVADRISTGMVLDFSVTAGKEPPEAEAREIHDAIQSFAPACVAMTEVLTLLPLRDRKWVAAKVFEGISRAWIRPRIEPVRFATDLPEFPKLPPFRLVCARNGLPLVDAWHNPCAFPSNHYEVLAAMDGSLTLDELAAFSKSRCPELVFEPWLRHLAWRGMFA